MSNWIGKKLKSGYDVFIVVEYVEKPGHNPTLHCEVVGNPRRKWFVPLMDNGMLPPSVEEFVV